MYEAKKQGNMKNYLTPTADFTAIGPSDIVCASRGLLLGLGGADIGNWTLNGPGAGDPVVQKISEERQ